jgi:hypothetical protein
MFLRIGLIAFVAGAALAAGAAAYASIPSPEGVIIACYSKSGGALRVIDSSVTNCKKGETSLSWNLQGQPGEPGADGAPGPAGEAGPPGPSWTVYVVEANAQIPAFTHLNVDRTCNSGDIALSGSYDTVPQANSINAPERSERTSSTTWTFGVSNLNNVPITVILGVVCADTTP